MFTFNGRTTKIYDNANHYYPARFTVYYGRDPHYPGFNGYISNFNFNAGQGAYVRGTQDKYNHPEDIFGYGEGLKIYYNKGDFKPKVRDVEKP
jgi:hypothetical protein